MVNVNFRSGELKDLEILYEFEQGIIAAERPFDSTLKPGKINYYDLKVLIESESAEVIIAEINHELIGSGYIKIRQAKDYLQFEKYGYIGFIYVKPEYRRKGISQIVIGRLRSWAKSKGINELRLNVYNDNENAVAAYKKLGMKKHMIEMRMEI